MNSPRYAGAPPSLVVGGVCLLASFSTFQLFDFPAFRLVGKLESWRDRAEGARQGIGGVRERGERERWLLGMVRGGGRRPGNTGRARRVRGEEVLQEVGGFLLLPRGKGGLQSGGYRAGAGVRFGGVYPGVREGNGSGTFSRVTASAEKEVA